MYILRVQIENGQVVWYNVEKQRGAEYRNIRWRGITSVFTTVGVKKESSATQEQVGGANTGVGGITSADPQIQNEQLKPENFRAVQFDETTKEERKPTEWKYQHNPWENETVRRDTVIDPYAVYGFRPSGAEGSSLQSFAKEENGKPVYDWYTPAVVEEYKRVREAYHKENEDARGIVASMRSEGASEEDIARVMIKNRNDVRINSYKDGDKIKDENGYQEAVKRAEKNSFENLIKRKTAGEIIESATKGNAGMDACVGLYDKYFSTY